MTVGSCAGFGAPSLAVQGACALSRLKRFNWVTSKEYDAEGHQDRTNHNSIISEAALLEVTPCEGVSVAVKTHSRWISGRAPSRVAATRPAPAARTLLAAAADRPCKRWSYLFDDAVGQLQQ